MPAIVSASTSGNALERLRRGRAFHALVQADWKYNAEGTITSERLCKKPSGRRGFIDIHATTGDEATAVVEIKCTDWDRMTSPAVVRNARRQVRQIWNYIESELAGNNHPSPGIVFPSLPKDHDRRILIESLFAENGITVIWYDQSDPHPPERLVSSSLQISPSQAPEAPTPYSEVR